MCYTFVSSNNDKNKDMKKFTTPYFANQMTKQERESSARMQPIIEAQKKYDKLMADAQQAKELFLFMKGNLKTVESSKLQSITACINSEKETAIDCWNKAQELKSKIQELKSELHN